MDYVATFSEVEKEMMELNSNGYSFKAISLKLGLKSEKIYKMFIIINMKNICEEKFKRGELIPINRVPLLNYTIKRTLVNLDIFSLQYLYELCQNGTLEKRIGDSLGTWNKSKLYLFLQDIGFGDFGVTTLNKEYTVKKYSLKTQKTDEDDIKNLVLSTRAWAVIKAGGIETISELTEKVKNGEIHCIRGCGKTTAAELIDACFLHSEDGDIVNIFEFEKIHNDYYAFKLRFSGMEFEGVYNKKDKKVYVESGCDENTRILFISAFDKEILKFEQE